jgi:hypothetical protein
MIWQVPRMWEGGDVWIIGGGPSLSKQFDIPDPVIKSVIEGASPLSVFSPYMTAIHNKHVIGVNVSYMLGTWIDMIFFGDTGFFLAHKQGLADFPGLRVSSTPHTSGIDWIKYLQKDSAHTRGISPNPKMISWNGNSGAAAISVAVHTGAKRIILLGFDMRLNGNRDQHWHNIYGKAHLDETKMRKLPFDRHLRGFPIIAEDAKRMGVEIINACPDSAITCFPRVSVKELL